MTDYLIDLYNNPNFVVDADGSGMAGLRDGSINAIFTGSWDAASIQEILGDNMGVAALHTEILKNSELKPFYDLYPEKFNNKTNGVTFRRWLEACDPALARWISARIATAGSRMPPNWKKLLPFAEDEASLTALLEVKQHNKRPPAAAAGPPPGRGGRRKLPSSTSRSSACTSTSASR